MTPEGRTNVDVFFSQHPLTNSNHQSARVVGGEESTFDNDAQFFDILLYPNVYPGMVMSALAEVNNQVGGENYGSNIPPVGRVTLKFVTTFNTSDGGLGMTFEDTDARLRSSDATPIFGYNALPVPNEV